MKSFEVHWIWPKGCSCIEMIFVCDVARVLDPWVASHLKMRAVTLRKPGIRPQFFLARTGFPDYFRKMKTFPCFFVIAKVSAVFTIVFAGATSAYAAPAKTYQVTGPVLELNAKTITVQKGKEKWEIARDPQTDMPADVKVGDKVTANYYMVATTVESKGDVKAAATKKKPADKK
jgi:hypothetical protein